MEAPPLFSTFKAPTPFSYALRGVASIVERDLDQHGIGWVPEQREVWENSSGGDPHVHIWDLRNPMAPVWKGRLTLRSGRGSHWLTFTIKGDYGYIAPIKNGADGTEIFDARSYTSVGVIGSSEDMLEIDFANGKVSQVGDQYGIGR